MPKPTEVFDNHRQVAQLILDKLQGMGIIKEVQRTATLQGFTAQALAESMQANLVQFADVPKEPAQVWAKDKS